MSDLNKDQADQIHELAKIGYGRKKIAKIVGVTDYAVRQVIAGTLVDYKDDLSTRQRQALLNRAFSRGR